MNVKLILGKLTQLEIAMSTERGPFDLLALFSTEEEVENRWDLVVAATWIDENTKDAIDYITKRLRSILTREEFQLITKIAPLDVYDPRVKDIQTVVTTEHRLVNISNYKFYGFWVEDLYVITCKFQIDQNLMYSIWDIISKLWESGNKTIESEEVLKRLESAGHVIQPYAIDRVLECLISSGCIKGPQYLHSDDVKAHGAMIITSVTPRCPAILQTRLQDFMLEVVLRQAQNSMPNQWIPTIEYKLWFIVSEGMGGSNPTEKIDRKLHVSNHLDAITVEDIFRLKHLSNEADGWCKWDWPDTRVFPGHKPTFVPMSEWKKMATMESYLDSYIVR